MSITRSKKKKGVVSIRNKVGVAFGIILLVSVASFLYSNYYIGRITNETKLLNCADRMLEDTLQIRRYEKDFILRGGDKYVNLVKSYISKLSSEIDNYKKISHKKSGTKDINKFIAVLEDYKKSFSEYTALRGRAPHIKTDALVSYGRKISNLSEEIKSKALSCITCCLDKIRKSHIVVLLSFVFSAYVVFWIISRTVIVPIKKFQMLSKKIMEDGMLDPGQIKLVDSVLRSINTDDEIGELARTYREMVVKCHNSYLGLHNKVEEVEGLYKIKSEFTSIVSHELRTPLTAIKEGIELVLDGSAGRINNEQKEFLGIAKRNVDRLARLINYVLDFSKLTSKKFEFKKEVININEMVSSAADTYRLVAEKKGLFVRTRLETSEKLIVELDADRINQVLTNLIDNAVKFTDKGGVTISTSKDKEGNFVMICVEDTGAGINKADIPKLFQPFSQLGGVQGRKVGGTGLGLAICKEIVEQSGGKIWVESILGKGSKFCFILPVRERRERGS